MLCACCQKEKQPDAFYFRKVTQTHRKVCKQCLSDQAAKRYKEKWSEYRKRLDDYREIPGKREQNRQRGRKWYYRENYGMSLEDWDALAQRQGCKCAICKVPFVELRRRMIHVDHCHDTGAVRGLLCHHCNQILGNARDNTETLQAAVKYLDQIPEPEVAKIYGFLS